METQHWSEDTYWTDALERLYRLREEGKTQLTLDLTAIEEIVFNGDGPAYKLMDAIIIRTIPGSFAGGTGNTGYFLMRPVGNPQPFDPAETEAIEWVPYLEADAYIQ